MLAEDRFSLTYNYSCGVFYDTEKERKFVQEYKTSILDLFIIKNTPFNDYGTYYSWFNSHYRFSTTLEEELKYPLLYCSENYFILAFEAYLNNLFKNENKNKNFFKRIRI